MIAFVYFLQSLETGQICVNNLILELSKEEFLEVIVSVNDDEYDGGGDDDFDSITLMLILMMILMMKSMW